MKEIVYIIIAAVLFGVSPLFMKSGIKKTSAYVGATVWSTVMLIAAIIVCLQRGTLKSVGDWKPMALLFLILSGMAIGGAIIFLFKALKDGEAIKVVPIMAYEFFASYILYRILERRMPGIPVIVVLIAITIAVVLMSTKSKGRGGNKWALFSVLAVAFELLGGYLFAKVKVDMGTSFHRLCIFTIVVIMLWIVTLATGSLKSIRNMSFLEGIYLIISVLCLWGANKLAINVHGTDLRVALLACPVATLIFAILFLKEKVTTQYMIGLILFEFLAAVWMGYVPVLSAML